MESAESLRDGVLETVCDTVTEMELEYDTVRDDGGEYDRRLTESEAVRDIDGFTDAVLESDGVDDGEYETCSVADLDGLREADRPKETDLETVVVRLDEGLIDGLSEEVGLRDPLRDRDKDGSSDGETDAV